MLDGEIPKEAGNYNVKVIYPETEIYFSIETDRNFEIMKVNLVANVNELYDNEHLTIKDNNGQDVNLKLNEDYKILYFVYNEENVYETENGSEIYPGTPGTYVMRVILINDSEFNYCFNGDTNYKDFDFFILHLDGGEPWEEEEE